MNNQRIFVPGLEGQVTHVEVNGHTVRVTLTGWTIANSAEIETAPNRKSLVRWERILR